MEWFEEFFSEDYLKLDRHEDTKDEVDFIEEKLELSPSARILDLCCGYGRHAIELAKRGYRVTGYDLSQVLLERAREDGSSSGVQVEWVEGDMRRLPFEGTFDAVINMFTSFGYFADESQNLDVLKGVSRVLVPKGRFLIDTVNRDFLVRHFAPLEWFRSEGTVVLERRSFDVVANRSNVQVTVIRDGEEKEYHHSIRVYSFTELRMLLSAVGLATLEMWGDFDGGDYSWDSRRMIVLAQKP